MSALDEHIQRREDGNASLQDAEVLHEEQEFNARFVHHTNVIEGSKLNFDQTFEAIKMGGIHYSFLQGVGKGTTPRIMVSTGLYDVFEAITLSDVLFTMLRDQAGFGPQTFKPTLSDICKVHQDIFYSTKEYSGAIRKSSESVIVKGSGGVVYSRGAEPESIVPLLKELEQWYSNSAQYGCLVQAAVVHNQLLHIHPFKDGNGRVARVVLAQIMNSGGLPVPIVKVERKLPYYVAIQEFQQDKNIEPMLNFLLASAHVDKAEQMFTSLVRRGLRTIK
jgi:Fic family protein